jgi:hypothetical protein
MRTACRLKKYGQLANRFEDCKIRCTSACELKPRLAATAVAIGSCLARDSHRLQDLVNRHVQVISDELKSSSRRGRSDDDVASKGTTPCAGG